MEARGFRDAIDQFREVGAEVVGISADRLEAQRRFATRTGLDFPMLADPGGDVLRAWGVRGLLGFAKRVTFLVGPDGRIERVWRNVSPSGHAREVLDALIRQCRSETDQRPESS